MNDRPASIQATLARNLRLARERSGWSQQEVADRAGLDRTYLSNLERGIGNPSLTKMASLSTVLSTSVPLLLTPEGESAPSREQATLMEVVAVLRRNGVVE